MTATPKPDVYECTIEEQLLPASMTGTFDEHGTSASFFGL
jgi:hypothetical protein